MALQSVATGARTVTFQGGGNAQVTGRIQNGSAAPLNLGIVLSMHTRASLARFWAGVVLVSGIAYSVMRSFYDENVNESVRVLPPWVAVLLVLGGRRRVQLVVLEEPVAGADRAPTAPVHALARCSHS